MNGREQWAKEYEKSLEAGDCKERDFSVEF